MNETQNMNPNNSPSPETVKALDNVKAIAGEHFDNYLLVFMKDGQQYRTYNNSTVAFGMASFICGEVSQNWFNNHQGGK